MQYNPNDDQYSNLAAEFLFDWKFPQGLKCVQDFLSLIMLKIKSIFSIDASDFSIMFCGLL